MGHDAHSACLVWGGSAGIQRVLRSAPQRGMLCLLRGACCITQPPGHPPFLDPRRAVHVVPKAKLGRVQVVLYKTSSLSNPYTQRPVYLDVTLGEPRLRI